MSADNGPQDRDGERASGISRREVLLTVGGVAAAVGAGAAMWGGLEFFVSRQHTVGGGLNVTYAQVVMVLGTLACVLGVILSIRTARTRFDDVGTARKDVNIGVARVTALVFARLVALMALIVLPAGAVFLANYHTFEGVHEVRGCASCHVMLPMINDMRDYLLKVRADLTQTRPVAMRDEYQVVRIVEEARVRIKSHPYLQRRDST